VLIGHVAQHYLLHLLRAKLVASRARIVIVSSGAIRMVKDPSTLDATLLASSGAPGLMAVYPASKLAQLFAAHWWRRALADQCTVVAVSPGLIPDTGLGRSVPGGFVIPPAMLKDAKSVPEGTFSLLLRFSLKLT
jgi:NAD(P)-dependent dehydrogenase (short-subunit alcohol dehydrogenase family)